MSDETLMIGRKAPEEEPEASACGGVPFGHSLTSTTKAWNAQVERQDKELELYISEKDRPCIELVANELSKLPESERMVHLKLHEYDELSGHESTAFIVRLLELNKTSLKSVSLSVESVWDDHDGIHHLNPISYLRILLQMPQLEYIHLEHYDLCREESASFFHDIFSGPIQSLKKLRLTECLIDARTLFLFSSGVRHYEKLETLSIQDCGLTDNLASFLLGALGESQSDVKHVDVSGNRLGPQSFIPLASLLDRKQSLQSLNIQRNGSLFPDEFKKGKFNFRHLRRFTESIRKHKSLEELVIRSCSVGTHSFSILMYALESNAVLRKLDARYNLICMDLWVALLPKLEGLQSLDLSRNPLFGGSTSIQDKIAKAHWFMTQVRANSTLVELSVCHQTRGMQRSDIEPLLERNQYLWKVKSILQTKQQSRVPRSAWPHLLEQTGAIPAGGSPSYLFLRTNMMDLALVGSTLPCRRKQCSR